MQRLEGSGGSVVKNLHATPWDTRDADLILGWEDLLKKGMATHSSIVAWTISWSEEPGKLQSMGSLRVGHNLKTENTQNKDLA